MTAGERLRRARAAYRLRVTGMSLDAIAVELGVAATTVRRLLGDNDECYWIAKCGLCGDEFIPTRSDQHFCCQAHREKHRRLYKPSPAQVECAALDEEARAPRRELYAAYERRAEQLNAELARAWTRLHDQTRRTTT